MGVDPVRLKLVDSYNRPGGTVTGVNNAPVSLTVKRMELLLELVAPGEPIAELINPANPSAENEMQLARDAAQTVGREIVFAGPTTEDGVDAAFPN